MSMVSVLTSAILPVLSIAAVGYVAGRLATIETDSLATVTIYIMLPALVFHSLATTTIGGETIVVFVLGVVGFTVAMAGVAEAVGWSLSQSAGERNGLVLSATFPNVGNYGIPFMAFAFGAAGRSAAVLFVVGQSLMMYSLGVIIASRSATTSLRVTAGRILKLPLLYATVAGLVASSLGIVPPADDALMQTIKVTGDASIPVMLLLLGIELANMSEVSSFSKVAPASVLKLAVAPFVAAGIALALGLSGTLGYVFVLEGAMPTAITPLALAVEFGRGEEGRLATEVIASTVFVTTVLSVLTISVVLVAVTSGLSPF